METLITGIIGAIATIAAAIIGRRTAPKESGKELNEKYGVKIISPKEGDQVSEWVEVTGIYSIKPPLETLRLFTTDSSKTQNGERYWPQEIVRLFDEDNRTWQAKINIGNPDPNKQWSIVVGIVGQPTITLWNYYYKVGPKIGWWDFEGWPSDSKVCHRINYLKRYQGKLLLTNEGK